MARFRMPVTVGAMLLTIAVAPAIVGPVSVTPAAAEPQAMGSAAGAPLKLTPPARHVRKFTKQTRKFKRAARARAPMRIANRRVPPSPQPDDGAVMRGHDTNGLIAQLPWWRAAETRPGERRENATESQVLSATQAWLGSPGADRNGVFDPARALPDDLDESVVTTDTIIVADANEINEIDLAATEAPPPSDKTWFHALLAVLGGAFAAASAARFLLV